MKIFLTGSTGFVGKNILEAIYKDFTIFALLRDSKKISTINKFNVKPVLGSLFNLKSAYNLIDSLDVIIHVAGLTKTLHSHNYFKINSKGTFEILKFAKEKKVKHFIYISSLAAAGPSSSSYPVSEKDAPKPVSNYGVSKLLGEYYVKKSGIPYTIIRPPAIFGPGDKDIFTYFQMVKKRIAITSGDKNKLYSMIFVKDLAKAIKLSIMNKKAFNETFFVSNKEVYKISDIILAIEKSLDIKSLKINLPEFTTNLIFYPMQIFYAMSNSSPLLNLDKLSELKQNFWICSNKKIYEKIGFKAEYTLEQGMKDTGKWYIEKNWL